MTCICPCDTFAQNTVVDVQQCMLLYIGKTWASDLLVVRQVNYTEKRLYADCNAITSIAHVWQYMQKEQEIALPTSNACNFITFHTLNCIFVGVYKHRKKPRVTAFSPSDTFANNPLIYWKICDYENRWVIKLCDAVRPTGVGHWSCSCSQLATRPSVRQ